MRGNKRERERKEKKKREQKRFTHNLSRYIKKETRTRIIESICGFFSVLLLAAKSKEGGAKSIERDWEKKGGKENCFFNCLKPLLLHLSLLACCAAAAAAAACVNLAVSASVANCSCRRSSPLTIRSMLLNSLVDAVEPAPFLVDDDIVEGDE